MRLWSVVAKKRSERTAHIEEKVRRLSVDELHVARRIVVGSPDDAFQVEVSTARHHAQICILSNVVGQGPTRENAILILAAAPGSSLTGGEDDRPFLSVSIVQDGDVTYDAAAGGAG